MPAIELTLNVFVLTGIVFGSFVIGFLIRANQIRSLKSKIVELEREMLNNHADILELQRSKALLEQNLQASKIPVIPLNPTKEEGGEKLITRK
ncbi:MAG TPA: hypothetical protein VFN95_06375 [Flavitalea sp.]|nr:hypothetical protein [Flavitalea sp.]